MITEFIPAALILQAAFFTRIPRFCFHAVIPL